MAADGSSGNWNIVKRYTGEASVVDVKLKILKLLLDGQERSIIPDAGKDEQYRNICKGKQG